MNPLDTALQFLSGEMTVKVFENALYHDKDLEAFFRDPSINWHDTYVAHSGNIYDFLILQNFSRLGDIYNVFGAVELFLEKKGITYITISKKYSDLYDLMLDSQPRYIDADIDINSEFFLKHISPIVNGNLTKTEKKKQIREKYKTLFQYQSKPPKWIQGAEWIVKDGVPLFFVEQKKLKGKDYHDDGAVYIFRDTKTGEIETIEQFY